MERQSAGRFNLVFLAFKSPDFQEMNSAVIHGEGPLAPNLSAHTPELDELLGIASCLFPPPRPPLSYPAASSSHAWRLSIPIVTRR